jgi:hypothetical protein
MAGVTGSERPHRPARPLAELAPDLVHPADGRTLAAIAAALEAGRDPRDRPRLRRDVVLASSA